MDIKIKDLIPTILAIFVMIVGDVVLNVLDSNTQIKWGLVFAILVIQIFILKMELIQKDNTTPNIIFDGFKKEDPFHIYRGNKPGETVERYYIMFRNSKVPKKTICDTEPVHAILTFYDKECDILTNLSHEYPFWLDRSGPPWDRPGDFNVIIKASSKPEGLCLVIRQQGESDLYVFCDKSYISNTRDFKPFQASLRLPSQDRCLVNVQLIAKNLEMAPIWISIKNLGKNQEPLFELIDPPCS
ncbi:MAG: hypothetical protein K8R77_00975 [Anaerolineaceae bacterium]|nr:hypothetical protein [Anaerolineaceae bacterium]